MLRFAAERDGHAPPKEDRQIFETPDAAFRARTSTPRDVGSSS
ncbi:MAG: hypothetical protein AAFQ40_17425 [Cyanobacteria bacterium J06623_5]